MSEALAIAIAQYAIKFGLDAAILFAEKAGKPGATIDDAIAALRGVKDASAYLPPKPGDPDFVEPTQPS